MSYIIIRNGNVPSNCEYDSFPLQTHESNLLRWAIQSKFYFPKFISRENAPFFETHFGENFFAIAFFIWGLFQWLSHWLSTIFLTWTEKLCWGLHAIQMYMRWQWNSMSNQLLKFIIRPFLPNCVWVCFSPY